MNLDFDKINEFVQNQASPEPFSGVIYLTKEDEVLFAGEYGSAIKSEAIPNRLNTRFQTASGCKGFTALAICQLVDSGLLDFDTPLKDCLDTPFPNYPPDITIRHLLIHSSGITSYFEEDVNSDYEALWNNIPMYMIKKPGDFLPLFQSKPIKFMPGERFDYNDGGYILLGLIVEKFSGMSFPSYIIENIFKPAGMTDSGYFATDMLPERTAYAYIQNSDGSWRTNIFAVPVIGAPDGGAYTTAVDMKKYWTALLANKLCSANITPAITGVQIETGLKDPYGSYGYGIWIDQRNAGIKKIFLEGYDPGVAFRSAVYPEMKIMLTMLGNTSEALWPLYKKVEDEFNLH